MNKSTSPDVFNGNPSKTVTDNRGLAVRGVQYNRTSATDELDCLITRSTYNALGQLACSTDPRLFDKGLSNLSQRQSLAGQPLRVDSVDAGWRVALFDIEGAPHKEWDELGTTRRYDYDENLHRPVTVHEQRADISGGTEQVTERFVYGQASDTDSNLNLQLIRHYDNAGLSETTSISLTGQPLVQQLQLLTSKTDDSDWQGTDESVWKDPLEPTIYTTQWTYNALGMMLTQLDAKGNQQRSEYDVSGILSASYLLPADALTEQVLVSEIEYNANGQKTRELAGNGVGTTYTYDERDWRLMQVKTLRPDLSARQPLLQDLRYEYDPVGNIVSIEDAAEATRFYKNQRVIPKQTYTYDALYQLSSATGRENDSPQSQASSLSPLNDSAQYVTYSRQYSYDRAGNLHNIKHTGASQYTLDMQVSSRSNRAIQQLSATPILPDDVDKYFDAHGNLQKLEHSKAMLWGRNDQLKQVTLTSSQTETYQYTVQGARIRKFLSDSSTTAEQEVIYLPGIELRTTRNNGSLSEELHMLSLSNTGRNQVRLLHWAAGKPADIANDQLRYSLDNHLGSSRLELDQNADILTMEEYYPFGCTALWSAKNQTEAKYKTIRYSGKERDATGLYYYGYRYYMPWMGRWLNPDPAWTVDGLNLYRMVRNNPITLSDGDGRAPEDDVIRATKAIKQISKSAKLVRKNLNKSDTKVAISAGVNIATNAASGVINYTLGANVPAIPIAAAMLQGLSGTTAGDLANRAVQTVANTNFSYNLDIEGKPKSKKSEIVDSVLDYGFAIATSNSFPYAVTDTLGASSSDNFVTQNLTDASNLIYHKQAIAQQAYHDTGIALAKVDDLKKQAIERLDAVPQPGQAWAAHYRSPKVNYTDKFLGVFASSEEIDEKSIQAGAQKTKSRLLALQNDAYRIGYPAGYASKNFGKTSIGIEAHYRVNHNVKFKYID